MGWKTLDDMDLGAKTVLVRVDINVPVRDGKVTDTTRMDRIAPTIRDIIAAGGKPVLLAHFGRPKGEAKPEFSLDRIRAPLENALGFSVVFAPDCVGPVAEAAVRRQQANEVLLLENTRFHPGEEQNDPAFADALARLGDVYVNDAFSAAHRAHASTEGLARRLPSCAGRLMQAELLALDKALGIPARPVVAIVGGAKVSTKLALLANLLRKVDHLVIGGGMANTFLAAQGHPVGTSLCEHDLTDTAGTILKSAGEAGCEIVLPSDVVVATEFKAQAEHRIVVASACPADMMILDAGPDTAKSVADVLQNARTCVMNGPLGAFEIEPFGTATYAVIDEIARLTRDGGLVSVAGGGDTVAAINMAGHAEDFSYISTAGGAFLEWMEGKALPGVAALETQR